MKKILILFFSVLLNYSFCQKKEIYQSFGDSLISKGKYDEVINYFEKELKKHPKDEDILRWLGYTHILLNNADSGEKYYKQALEVNPNCARCYLNIGRAYALRSDNKTALEYFNRAVKLDTKDALIYSNRANLKEFLGDKSGALIDYDKAIELDSTNYNHYVQRAKFNSKFGYLKLANLDFNTAIKLAPQNFEPYYTRANFYYEQQKYNEALIDLNKSIELDKNQFESYIARGAIHTLLNQDLEAVEDYTSAITLNRADFTAYLNRAYSFYKLENLDAACEDYSILKLFIEQGKISDTSIQNEIINAIQDICIESKPSYYYQRGIGYYNLKEFSKALEIYSKGLEKFPNHSMMLSFKGNAHLALNEFENAIKLYDLSLNNKNNLPVEIESNPKINNESSSYKQQFINGSLSSTYYSLSECKLNLGKYDEALADIHTAIKLAPEIESFNKEVYYNLRGYTYMAMGKYDEAIADFNKSIAINKNFPLAYVNRAVASVSKVEKPTTTNFTINSTLNNQPSNILWSTPKKSTIKKAEIKLLEALYDCDSAIAIENNLGYAFYIRGQLKQMLKQKDFCMDLFTAKSLGVNVEEELLNNCGK